ncbi:MAG: 2-oxoglutarate dehydrogenase E1 component, partial [Pseudomonadota bacterium]|nr:2-oxoglutarate dehydrogenase E1 component [Pseudomonadota bacterium]
MNQQVKKVHDGLRQVLEQSSLLSGNNLDYVEWQFEAWLANPESVSEEWQQYFSKLPGIEGKHGGDVSHAAIIESFRGLPKRGAAYGPVQGDGKTPGSLEHEAKQVNVVQLISSYRVRGHQHARLDPLGLMHREAVPDLRLEFHNLSSADLNTVFSTASLAIPQKDLRLSEIV